MGNYKINKYVIKCKFGHELYVGNSKQKDYPMIHRLKYAFYYDTEAEAEQFVKDNNIANVTVLKREKTYDI